MIKKLTMFLVALLVSVMSLAASKTVEVIGTLNLTESTTLKDTPLDVDGILHLTGTKGTSNYPALNYNATNGTDLRFYKGETCSVTFATSASCPITKIEFLKNATTASTLGDSFSVNTGTLSGNVWTGSASSVTIKYENSANFSAQIFIINVTYTVADDFVKAPSFSPAAGEFDGSIDVTLTAESGTEIFYTTDGTTPTTSSTKYSSAIHLTATTTVKAIAAKGSNTSDVAEAVYSKIPEYASLAALVAEGAPTSAGKTVKVTLTDEVITRKVSNGVFVMSGEQEVELYHSGVPEDWEVGGTVSGTLVCPWKIYSGTWELCPAKWDDVEYTAPVSTIALDHIEVEGYRTELYKGGEFVFGGKVTATYQDGSSKDVTSRAEFSGYDLSKTGNQTVTVSFTDGAVTKTTSYSIKVVEIPVWVGTYTSNISDITGAKVVIGGAEYDALKAGKSGEAGTATITIPAGTKTFHLHALGWKGESVKLTLTGVAESPVEIAIPSDDGVSDNSPFTLSGTPGIDSYFSFEMNTEANTKVTVAATSGKRFVLFGANAEEDPDKLSIPTFSPEEALFDGTVDVTLASAEGADIHYTLDGSTPTTSSAKYSSAIHLTATTTVKAIAAKGGKTSAVAEKTYTKIPEYASLAALVAAGEPTKEGTTVKLTLTDEVIKRMVEKGIFLMSGEQEVEVYVSSTAHPKNWKDGGTVSGTVTGVWKLYNSTWEICPDSWDGLIYKDPKPKELTGITVSGYTTEIRQGMTFEFGGTVTANYDDGTSSDVTAKASFSGYDMSKAGVQKVTVSYTENEITKTADYNLTVTAAKFVSFDLSTTSYDPNPTAALIQWSNPVVTMKNEQNGGTSVINNYPGGGKTETRMYNKNILTITPTGGCTLKEIIFTASSNSYATAFAGSEFTNATADASEKAVTVTPTDGTKPVVAALKATCGFTNVTMYYEGEGPAPEVLSSIAIEGQKTRLIQNADFYFGGTVTATYESGKTANVTNSAQFSTVDMTTAGNKTVTVSYTDGEVTKKVNYTLTVVALTDANNYRSAEGALTTANGVSTSTATVIIDGTRYDAIKAGTGSIFGKVAIPVPANTGKVLLHAAGWSTESVELTASGVSTTPETITLEKESGLNGSGTTFTFSGDPENDDYFELSINGGAEADSLYLSAEGGKRFVIFGVRYAAGLPAPAAPVISEALPFKDNASITITAESGAEIRYTLDGTTPTASSTLYTGAIELTATTTVKAVAVKNGKLSAVASKTFKKIPAAPAFNPAEENFAESVEVTLSAETGAVIYYTLDGSTPTAQSTKYTKAIEISATTTVKAIAVKDELSSDVASKTYNKLAGAPVFTPAEETFDSKVSVTIAAETGAEIYYTLDGSTPTAESTKYTEAIELTATTTIKAVAVKSGVAGEVASKTYTLLPAKPVFAPEDAVFDGKVAVTITAQEGTSIHYTLDGSTPTAESSLYSKAIELSATTTIKAVAVKGGFTSVVAEKTYAKLPAVPEFTPAEVTFRDKVDVTLASDADATIYYTLDSSTPTVESAKYAEAITLTATTTIKAIAVKETLVSAVASKTYTKLAGAPVIAPETETFEEKVSVSITAEAGAEIYYTLDDTTPTALSTKYTTPFELTATTTVKAIAIKDGLAGDVSTKKFTRLPAVPVITPAEGEFIDDVEVSISSEEGTAIFYTLDGTDPTAESTRYEGPFTLTATTTVKAVAVLGGKYLSKVAQAVFTKAESFLVNITTLGWSTLYLEKNVIIPATVEVFFASSVTANKIIFEEFKGEILPARTPVIIRAKAEAQETFSYSNEEVEPLEVNLLSGSDVAIDAPEGTFVLDGNSVDSEHPVFNRFIGSKLAANKAYLVIPQTKATTLTVTMVKE